ncbi:hypothetical protein KEM56_007782 [Ascosphaera pollenicola]|nr:hypothetical protein KEM56_007782 [Ascosphaera pollenicola]
MGNEECANPLFLAWVKEMWDTAKLRNTKSDFVFGKAYRSLKAHPRQLEHPSEAQALQGIGPMICEKLTERLEEHCREHGLPMPDKPRGRKRTATSSADAPEQSEAPSRATKRKKATKDYVPKRRGGAYGLLFGLGTLDKFDTEGMTKSELIAVSQPHSDSSYTIPPPGHTNHTAWNSMKTLISHGLVLETGPRFGRQYLLTDQGWKVFEAMRPADLERLNGRANSEIATKDMNVISSRESREPSELLEVSARSIPGNLDNYETSGFTGDFQPVLLPPDSFTVELIVDHREVRARTDRNFFQKAFEEQGISTSSRALDLGDFVWVAKLKDPAFLQRYGDGTDEVMLSHIVERKRKSDLIESIKGGRFAEQKFRLQRSGIQNVIYLVEDSALSDLNQANYAEHMTSAKARTMVVEKFFVKETANIQETVKYLTKLTRKLREMFTGPNATRRLYYIPTKQIRGGMQGYQEMVAHFRSQNDARTIHVVAFPTFSFLCSKSKMLTLRDIYLKMLMSIRGVSAEKALAIQKLWPVPKALMQALKNELARGGRQAADSMISDKLGQQIGPAKIQKVLSKKIADVWLLSS